MRANADRELRHEIQKDVDIPKCDGREDIFIDYRTPPSRAEAAEMCAGCPLLELCNEAAQARRPAWGVWGGRVYGGMKKKVLTGG